MKYRLPLNENYLGGGKKLSIEQELQESVVDAPKKVFNTHQSNDQFQHDILVNNTESSLRRVRN